MDGMNSFLLISANFFVDIEHSGVYFSLGSFLQIFQYIQYQHFHRFIFFLRSWTYVRYNGKAMVLKLKQFQ